jgi:hypothetical protein
VQNARIKLKQSLNSKMISNAANGQGDIDTMVKNIPVNNKEKLKGKTNNPNGRPKGSTNKISGVSILESINQTTGKPFEQLLAEGYNQSILQQDKQLRQKYEQMILTKVVADKHEIDHTTLGESMKANFVFPKQELPDWQTIPTKITYD